MYLSEVLLSEQLGTEVCSASSTARSMTIAASLAALGYGSAGLCIGLLQGYAYVAAEACHALGLTTVEQQLRWFLPDRKAEYASTSAEWPGSVGRGATERTPVVPALVPTPFPAPPTPPLAAAAAAADKRAQDRPAIATTSASEPTATLSEYASAGTLGMGREEPNQQQQDQAPAFTSSTTSSKISQAPVADSHTAAPFPAFATAALTPSAEAGPQGLVGPDSAAPQAVLTAVPAAATGLGSTAASAFEGSATAATPPPPAAAAATEPSRPAESPKQSTPEKLQFIPLTGPFEPSRFQAAAETGTEQQQAPAAALAPHVQEQTLAQDDQQQQHRQLSAALQADLDRRLSSFALDHISPATSAATTATGLALLGSGAFAEDYQDDDLEDTGMDVGVGPLEPVEGELDLAITNSTGSNLLPLDSPLNPENHVGGGLAATAAAAVAAIAAASDSAGFPDRGEAGVATAGRPANNGSSSSSSKVSPGSWSPPSPRFAVPPEGGGVILPQSNSSEVKIGLPAQRHMDPLARTSNGSTVSDTGSNASLSAQFNACYTRQSTTKQHMDTDPAVVVGTFEGPSSSYRSSSSSSSQNARSPQGLSRASPALPAAAVAAVAAAPANAAGDAVGPGFSRTPTAGHPAAQGSRGSKVVAFSELAGRPAAGGQAGKAAVGGGAQGPAAGQQGRGFGGDDVGRADQKKGQGLFGRLKRKVSGGN